MFPVLLIIGIGFVCSHYLSEQVKQQLQRQSHTKLAAIAAQVSGRLQDAINLAVNDLQALQAFYGVNEKVSAQTFSRYMAALAIDQRSYIQALSWVPLVSREQRTGFEAETREQYPNFLITERNDSAMLVASGEKNHYTPVTDIAPYASNRSAQGFDLNSSPTRRASLEYARDSGNMTATAKIRLVQERGESFGFLMIAPVYSAGLELGDAGQRSRALKGYVTGVFRVDSLMEKPNELALDEMLTLALIDLASASGGLLYGTETETSPFTFDLNIPGRNWQLQVAPNHSLQASIDSPEVVSWIMQGGIVMSILLGICLYALQHITFSSRYINELNRRVQVQNRELEATVAERTESLAQKNATLSFHIEELTTQRRILSSLMEDSQAAKNEAEQRARELARSNRDLDDFAYVASHDLKSPLRGIDQLASWVVEDLNEGDMSEIPANLSLMRQRVRRLETLLNDLLAYSRVSRQQSELTSLDSATLFNDMFMLNAPPPDFRLTIHGALPLLSTVVAPFEQVVRNLFSNAIKHHHRPDGHIQVRCSDEGDYYRFEVEDDGPGIDSDHYEQIFKMFKTLKPRDETEGSGMGLALIKRIVEHYKGKVYLTSSLGEGSCFAFTWPKAINPVKAF